MALWRLFGQRESTRATVIGPGERIGLPATVALGVQHAAAMFFSCVLVPALTGLPIATTLFFSGVGTCVFVIVTKNRVPGFLGSSFAFIAPLAAARADGVAAQLGGVVVAGLLLFALGIVVKSLGVRLLEGVLPPVVTGAVVVLVGVNLAPPAALLLLIQPTMTVATVVMIVAVLLFGRGMLRRFAVLVGTLVVWGSAWALGALSPAKLDAVGNAAWFGMPHFYGPVLHPTVVLTMVPAVVVLAAEYIAHIKAVSSATGTDLDGRVGDAVIAGGLASVLSGFGGAAPMTNSPANLGVFASSKVYSTAPCVFGGVVALVLAFCPKFTAVLGTIPLGAVGGAAVLAVGMVLRIALRIWQTGDVQLADPLTVTLAVVAILAGIAGTSLAVAGIRFDGVAWGALAIVLGYPLLAKLRALFSPAWREKESARRRGIGSPS